MTEAILNNGRQTFAPRGQGSSGVPATSVHLPPAPKLAPGSLAGAGFVRRAIRLAWNAARKQTETTVVGEFRQLRQGMVERAHFPKGGRITCRSGSLWITADGGGEDVVLCSGEFRWFPPGTRLLIEAMARSEALVEA